MHELGVVFQVIKTVDQIAEENQVEVSKVVLELGEVSTVIPEYLHDCWKWAIAKRSIHMKESELEIERIPAITFCEACEKTYGTVEFGKKCPHCGSEKTYLLQGNEFKIKEIEGG